ncbi:MAG: hypothetical protein WCD66_13365 [Rhodanobacteraceae bacterium]
MSAKSKSAVLLVLAGGLLMSAAASARGMHASKIDINFAQTFVFAQCPDTAPAQDACLNVTGVADQPGIGHAEFSRVAMVDPSSYDYTHPACLPIETIGTLTLPRGSLDIHAPGHVCFADGVASYDIIITGGTGAYAGALGSGKIVVPPPETNSTGRELWHLQLVRNHPGHHWPH